MDFWLSLKLKAWSLPRETTTAPKHGQCLIYIYIEQDEVGKIT